MKIVKLVFEDEVLGTHNPVPVDAERTAHNLMGRVYGMAIHPSSEILAVMLCGGDGQLIERGAPVSFGDKGMEAADVRTFKRVSIGCGTLVLMVAESPTETLILPRDENPMALRRSYLGNLEVLAPEGGIYVGPRMFCDVPRGTFSVRLWIPLVPVWTEPVDVPDEGAHPVFGWGIIAYSKRPPGNVGADPSPYALPAITAQGYVAKVILGGTLTQNAEFEYEADIPEGAVAIAVGIVCTDMGQGTNSHPVEIHLAITRT